MGWSLHTSMMRTTGWTRLLTLQLLAHLRIIHLHTRLMHPLQKHLKSKPRGHENTSMGTALSSSIDMMKWSVACYEQISFQQYADSVLCTHITNWLFLFAKCKMIMNYLIHNAIHYGAQIMMSNLLLLSLESMQMIYTATWARQ